MSVAYRRSWTSSEDKALIHIVDTLGTSDWTQISSELKSHYSIQNRSGKQCRERYRNHLDPSINKSPFTPEEDNTIFKLYKQLGKSWKTISKFIPGRSDNSIKNRFYSKLRKKLRIFNKSKPRSKKITGSIRTILRNSEITDLLLGFNTEESHANIESKCFYTELIGQTNKVDEELNDCYKDAMLLYELSVSEFSCKTLSDAEDKSRSVFNTMKKAKLSSGQIFNPVIIVE